MALISFIMFLLLQAVALLHLGWALGLSWPAKTQAELAPMVVGTSADMPMPPVWLTLAVALAISGIGIAALWGAGWFSFGPLDRLKSWLLAAIAVIFTLRGIATYLPFGPLQASVEPFRSLDRLYFAPMILLLALGFWLLFADK